MTAKSLAAGGCFCGFHPHSGRITPGDSKRGISGYLRDHVVSDKLGNFDPFSPFILLITDVGPKVLIDFAIQSLHLSIGLRVEHSGHLPFNAQ